MTSPDTDSPSSGATDGAIDGAVDVLVVGGGGREHALVWALQRSPRCGTITVSPGNGGTAGLSGVVHLTASGNAALVAAAVERGVGLVVVGPEAPLADGLADDLAQAGIPCFGPSAAGAELEASKAFSKAFMDRHGIPTARYRTFDDPAEARAWLAEVDYPVVLKASGLAAGKGVLLPESDAEALAALDQLMTARAFGTAGSTVVIEERLTGPEVSVLAITDGTHVRVLPPAQDHKRVFDGDEGPNTGGMGAYAPAPVLDAAGLSEVVERVLKPAVDGLRAEGRPYCGVLYAGMMVTPEGLKTLEFNCRFGDPETQVVLPLLDEDLLEVMLAATRGALTDTPMRVRSVVAATVVAASGGYPGAYEKGVPISGLEDPLPDDVLVFHAGTALQDSGWVTSGGRVLAVTGLGETLEAALERAYAGQANISFDGKHQRSDIGWRALDRQNATGQRGGQDDEL